MGSILFILLSVVLLVVLYTFILSNSNPILEYVALGISIFLFFIHLFIILKNYHITNQSKRLIVGKNVYQVSNSLLESYVIFSICNYKRCVMTKKQIYFLIENEIELGHLLYDKETLQISPKWHLEDADISTKFLLKAVLLDSQSFQQSEETKWDKIVKYQEDKKRVPVIDVEDNITRNLSLTSSIRELLRDIKKKYFVEFDNKLGSSVTIISYLLILLNFVMAFTFLSAPTITNFYLPVGLSLLLGLVTTSKYQEKVVICGDKIEEVTNILNYMENQKDFLTSNVKSKLEEVIKSQNNF